MPVRHLPPPVHYPLARPLALVALLCPLLLCTWALLLCWLLPLPAAAHWTHTALRLGLAAAALGATPALLWHGWRGIAVGTLLWDGQQWWLHADAVGPAPAQRQALQTLRVRADGTSWIWIEATARRYWLLPTRRQHPVRWATLRRAVHSTPPSGLF